MPKIENRWTTGNLLALAGILIQILVLLPSRRLTTERSMRSRRSGGTSRPTPAGCNLSS